jgi:hypothetical protein
MNSVRLPSEYKNLWDLPDLLLQKFPSDNFRLATKIKVGFRVDGECFGLVVMGLDNASIRLTNRGGKVYLSETYAKDADKGSPESATEPILISTDEIILTVTCTAKDGCVFGYEPDGKTKQPVGEPFKPREGRWIGAKVGLFFTRPADFNDGGTADVDWFRFEMPKIN